MVSVWKELKILHNNELDSIQAKVNAFVTPDDIEEFLLKYLHLFQVSLLNSGKIGH